MSFAEQPGNAVVNASLDTQPMVEVTDAAGNRVTNTYNNEEVKLEITPSTNPYGAVLKNGTAPYQATGATFSNVSVDEGGEYTLTAKMGDLQGISNVFTVSNTTAVISQVQGCVLTGATEGEITVTGQDFVRASVVRVNGFDRATTYVSGQQLTAMLTADDLASADPMQISVFTPSPPEDGLVSGNFGFTPTSGLDAGNTQEVTCSENATGTSFPLEATAPAGTYSWSFVNGLGSISDDSALNPTVEVKSASATLRLTVTTTNGCTFSDDVALTVKTIKEPQQEPLLVSKQTNAANNIWEISIDLSEMKSINLGSDPVYMWYTSNTPDGDWGNPVQTTVENRFELINPPTDLKVQARVLNRGNCQLYMFGFGQATPLPVELMSLKAVKQGNDAVITWATAMEQNNRGFEVEVSTEGYIYRALGFVPTKNGDSSIKQEYTFKDTENGKHGTRYYRLKQIDEDGTVALYGPRLVLFEDVRNQVKAYPNPFINKLNVDVAAEQAQEVHITIHDILGKVITARSLKLDKGTTSSMFTLPDSLPRGLYILKVQQGNLSKTVKVVKE
ncbi:T9SS type A sorting domain-containing protein [Pontibacter oryzae]|uniref:T9SS type A sorting domain-containing protein n=1 Tax=Pontibacter oryzae TaxID=2304593 RepID=UPI0013157CD5|nr:T9SS type A sorting domain-containing protein [Pontibacter oryzae]